MDVKEYTTKTGLKQLKPVIEEEELNELLQEGNIGFCLACGSEASQVEPDARQYKCEACGTGKVYGLEQLLLMGLVCVV